MDEQLRRALMILEIRFSDSDIAELSVASENVLDWIGHSSNTFPRTCEPAFIQALIRDSHDRR
jgi:hypothetical protein